MVASVSRLDPTQSFIDYVNTVKPYHTKILEVGVEYLWNDDINVTIADSSQFNIDFLTDDTSTEYLHGWGSTWDAPTQFQTTVFRVADFSAGVGGSITIEGNHTADMSIGDKFITWYDTDILPGTTVYTVTAATLVSGNTRLSVVEPVVGASLSPWYGLAIKAIPLVKYDKSTQSVIVAGDVTQLAVDGTLIYTPSLLFTITGVQAGTQVDRCYFEISGNHVAFFPDGTQFSALTAGANTGKYNIAPGGAFYDSVNNITRLYVQQAIVSSVVTGQLQAAAMQIVQHSTPDFQILSIGPGYFIVRGDRRADFPNSGPGYQFVSNQGDVSGFLTTVNNSQQYVSADPDEYLSNPFYTQYGLTNVTIISTISATPSQSYVGGYVAFAQDQTQIFVKSEVDELPVALASQYVFCFPNGEGWSSPEYSALLTASQLHSDSYIHERFTIEIETL